MIEGRTNNEVVLHETRQRIIDAFGLPEGTGVFLTPSGSDAEYIPLVIAKLLNGQERRITNIVTCNEEVGSGTLDASGGRFFSTLEPIPGYTDGVEMHQAVQDLGENVQTIAINARLSTGEVIDPETEIQNELQRIFKKNEIPILHSVFGSKTGIC